MHRHQTHFLEGKFEFISELSRSQVGVIGLEKKISFWRKQFENTKVKVGKKLLRYSKEGQTCSVYIDGKKS
jgi:hypothetical protein